MDVPTLVRQFDALADRATRSQAAVALAHQLGARAMFIFVTDPERPDTWLPAPLFAPPPSPRGWRALLRGVRPSEDREAAVAFPNAAETARTVLHVFDDVAFALIDPAGPRREELSLVARLLGALLHREISEIAMRGQLELERQSTIKASELAKALDRARNEAERAARVKDDFLAMLGHELRNPLAPMVTGLQLLRLEGVNSRVQVVLERQLQHVMRLVDDLLDVARITRGKVELRKEVVETALVIERAVALAQPLLDEKQQRLVLQVPEQGLSLVGDPARLAQIFSNLITNASKYSDAGTEIAVEAFAKDKVVVVEVRDQGIGLAPDYVDRIFDSFVQVPQDIDRASGGLGLGLAIVKNLVHLHGGAVRVHSAGLGHGSTFTVELPRRVRAGASSAEISIEVPPVPFASRRVLIVDDNEDAAEILATVLEMRGHEVKVVHDGPAALAALESYRAHVALLDIGLPGMDGFELAGKLRGAWPELRLIAVTGYGQPNDRERTRVAGFSAHLVKPVLVDDVMLALQRLAS